MAPFRANGIPFSVAASRAQLRASGLSSLCSFTSGSAPETAAAAGDYTSSDAYELVFPAKCEVIGGDYIEYRFDSWVNAVRSFFSGRMASAKTPPPFAERQIVRDTLAALEAQP